MNLSEKNQLIWDEAFERQDLRNDTGHAQTVTEFATKLGEILHADLDIIIPSAILHDTGYYGMSSSELNDMMAKKLSEERTKEIKKEHMDNGVRFAKELLDKINYDSQKIELILHIIQYHDTKIEPITIEEKIVRDADKLWRYSQKGFFLDIKRQNKTIVSHLDKLRSNLNRDDYFYTKEAVELADELLNKIKEQS